MSTPKKSPAKGKNPTIPEIAKASNGQIVIGRPGHGETETPTPKPQAKETPPTAKAAAPKTEETPVADPVKLRLELKRELKAEEEERKQSRKYTEVLDKVSQIKAKSEQLEILEKYGRKLADMVIDGNTQKVFFHIKVNDQEPFETSNPAFVASVLNIAKQQISSKTDEVFQALKELA